MKLTYISGFLVILLVLIYGHDLSARNADAVPIITVDQPFWDYGNVPFDFNMVHFYRINNDGEAILKLKKVGSNCDCTTASAIDTLVAPGKSTLIRVDFWTTDFYGTNVRKISIESNDPESPLITLEYNSNIGEMPDHIKVEPEGLFYLPTVSEKTLKLINNSGDEINYTISLEADSLITTKKYEGVVPKKGTSDVVIRVNDDLPKGTRFTSFNIQFVGESALRMTVPIKIVRF